MSRPKRSQLWADISGSEEIIGYTFKPGGRKKLREVYGKRPQLAMDIYAGRTGIDF